MTAIRGIATASRQHVVVPCLASPADSTREDDVGSSGQRSFVTRRPRLSGWLATLALIPALVGAVPTAASASHANAAVAATAPASLPATPAGTPFLWEAATSSYQVHGRLNFLHPGPG